MSKVFEIISKYTSGEKTLEETNAELKKMKAGFYLDPAKNVLTPGTRLLLTLKRWNLPTLSTRSTLTVRLICMPYALSRARPTK